MTTIILTIIGILLAAAAALMVIFYGGDAFNSGTVGAQANQIQNAGTNVVSAVQMFKAEQGNPPANVNALRTPAANGIGAYLDELPALPGSLSGDLFNATGTGAGANVRIYRVSGVDGATCARINTNLRVAIAGVADLAAANTASTDVARPKMGCVPFPATGAPTGGVFFARA